MKQLIYFLEIVAEKVVSVFAYKQLAFTAVAVVGVWTVQHQFKGKTIASAPEDIAATNAAVRDADASASRGFSRRIASVANPSGSYSNAGSGSSSAASSSLNMGGDSSIATAEAVPAESSGGFSSAMFSPGAVSASMAAESTQKRASDSAKAPTGPSPDQYTISASQPYSPPSISDPTSSTDGIPAALAIYASATGWRGLCQTVRVYVTDASGNLATATSTYSIAISVDSGNLFSESTCTNMTNTVSLASGSQFQTYYFKPSTSQISTLTASTSGLSSSSSKVVVGSPVASLVAGQPDFASSASNNDTGGVSARTIYNPSSVVRASGKLIVGDSFNHRVLIWNSVPSSNYVGADYVLGQPNMNARVVNNGGVTAKSLDYPTGVHYDGQRLFVADETNNRVLIWNSLPTANQQAADIVLGQPNKTSSTANNGGIGSNTLNSPECVYSTGTVLYVCDSGNNRILKWNSIPTVDQTPADVVIGQATMNGSGSSATATTLNYPYLAYPYGSKLLVSDNNNNRVLVWNTIPTTNGAPADIAIGQSDLVSSGTATTASGLNSPGLLQVDSYGRLIIPDCNNNRILVWNQIPILSGAAADAVIGQANFTSSTVNSGGISTTSLNCPWATYAYGNELWASDFSNQRVLKYPLP